MDVPGVVREALGGEEVHAHVSLGGPGVDALYVTPTRTVVYEEEGLLSDESATEIRHDAEQVAVSEGRRKATIRLSYGLEEDSEVVVPARQVDEALHPILAGVLAATGVIDEGEGVAHTYRFNELTLVVTSDRLVKHVGSVVWDAAEYEQILFADVRDVGLEEGSVSTQLVLETADRQERIKTPAESARQVHADVEDAILAFHGVASYDEFREAVAPDGDAEETGDTSDFAESGLDPISTTGTEEAEPPTDAPDIRGGADADDAGAAAGDAGEPDIRRAESGPEPESASAPDAGGVEAAGTEGDTGAAENDAGATGRDDTDAAESADGDEGFEGSPFEPASSRQSPDPEVVEAELRALDESLARQADLIEEQRDAIEALVEELGLD